MGEENNCLWKYVENTKTRDIKLKKIKIFFISKKKSNQ